MCVGMCVYVGVWRYMCVYVSVGVCEYLCVYRYCVGICVYVGGCICVY